MNAATKDWLKLNKIERTHISTSPNLLESKYDPMLHSEVSESMMEETRERQDEIFREFKKHVLKFREGKFKPDAEAQIFTADVVTGQKALEFGLIDRLGLCDQVVRDKYGPKTVLVDFSKKSKMEEFSSRFQLKAQSLLQQAISSQVNKFVN
jgi:ClpP class serine protease